MKPLYISDTTLKLYKNNLSFRKKIDVSAILDRMHVPVIELGEVSASTEDRLLLKTVAAAAGDCVLAVSVGLNAGLVSATADCLAGAKHPRLQVSAPLSTARMEYVYHRKAGDILAAVTETVAACKALCPDVEFVADDATRADPAFLKTVLTAAIEAGATTVTVSDTAGTALPDELSAFLDVLTAEVPGISSVRLGVECFDELGLANALAVAAVKAGADEIKASACHPSAVSLPGLLRVLRAKVGTLPEPAGIDTENFAHPVKMIANLCDLSADGKCPFENGLGEIPGDVFFTARDSEETVSGEIAKLGYLLSPEDREKVYRAFKRIVSRKERIDLRELEAIVASEALQVPQTYKLENSVVTTGHNCDALAHIKLSRGGTVMDGISLGNGSVDASFLAIEKITGCHYELDDFQIQAITEGKEAMGQTLVKLRSHGKLYSGKGVSTDIVISAIEAYLNSLNKIVYEEEQT